MADTPEEWLHRARVSLEGLSVGDALGGFFEFSSSNRLAHHVKTKTPPKGQWHYTDDTNMALSIYENLRLYGEINQDQLALSFATHFERGRGYGPSIHRFAPRVRSGQHWRKVSSAVFGGNGSFANGGAMRVAPLGGYFADDLDALIENARHSSEVTHAHPEGIAGTIAVAVVAAYAWNLRGKTIAPQAFIEFVLPHIPPSEVYNGTAKAASFSPGTSLQEAVDILGNGSRVTAQDTIPFVLWCTGEKLNNYEDAIWFTASGGGDVDTNCAMVGGIVAAYTGVEGIPTEWITAREPLPTWALGEAKGSG
ncbi:MAG: ADP-ribosylglycohydrolase family protein [Anaerolineae bacterium]|nr:ADP-ribosylglycohydrolase family protein [Anaerolineae bacterium]